MVPPELLEVADKVKAHQHPETTVRTLLKWFGAYRRSWRNVERIREALAELGLTTFPDFEGEYIDGITIFKPDNTLPSPAPDKATLPNPLPATESSHRIGRLKSANTAPLYVPPDATLQAAVTLMLYHDFSQLPVMQSSREVKGLVSWKSIGARLATGSPCACVRDCMEKHREISLEASLFDAVRIIAEDDSVLVRAGDKTICGIITAYDISAQFQQLAEPFLLLGDIENHMRYLVSRAFSKEELQAVKDPTDSAQAIDDASDLTLGQYVRLLQKPGNWAKLKVELDGKQFIDWLDKVREIRNDVMHFDPDPIDPAPLKAFAQFLKTYDGVASSAKL